MDNDRHNALPLLVTAQLDAAMSARLEALRRQHFPPQLNRVPAHVSLFHQLPGDALPAIVQDLREVTLRHAASPLQLVAVRSLGRGVALVVEAPGLVGLRAALAKRWDHWLTPQDKQSYRPHATIQNKVTADAARALLTRLQASFAMETGSVEGLLLWRYRGGPWEPEGDFPLKAR